MSTVLWGAIGVAAVTFYLIGAFNDAPWPVLGALIAMCCLAFVLTALS